MTQAASEANTRRHRRHVYPASQSHRWRVGRSSPRHHGLPGLLPATRVRAKAELRSYLRSVSSIVLTLALPILMLVVFGALFVRGHLLPAESGAREVILPG